MKYLLYFLCLTFGSCFFNKKNKSKVSNQDKSKPYISYVEPTGALNSKLNDSIIWNGKETKLYAYHKIIRKGEEQVIILNEKKDTLLTFNHEDGGTITSPFVIKTKNQIFVNFFEVWQSNGFLSKKRFYHLNNDKKLLEEVRIPKYTNILEKVKEKFSIKDSIYSRKGEFYKDFLFDKNSFNKNGELPFTLTIFNQSNPNLNNGLEGYKKLQGVYKFEEKNSNYFLIPDNLTIEN